jgi:hypothetical protein
LIGVGTFLLAVWSSTVSLQHRGLYLRIRCRRLRRRLCLCLRLGLRPCPQLCLSQSLLRVQSSARKHHHSSQIEGHRR